MLRATPGPRQGYARLRGARREGPVRGLLYYITYSSNAYKHILSRRRDGEEGEREKYDVGLLRLLLLLLSLKCNTNQGSYFNGRLFRVFGSDAVVASVSMARVGLSIAATVAAAD